MANHTINSGDSIPRRMGQIVGVTRLGFPRQNTPITEEETMSEETKVEQAQETEEKKETEAQEQPKESEKPTAFKELWMIFAAFFGGALMLYLLSWILHAVR